MYYLAYINIQQKIFKLKNLNSLTWTALLRFPKATIRKQDFHIFLTEELENYLSTVAQMAEWAPQDRKVLSLNPALDPLRPRFKEQSV